MSRVEQVAAPTRPDVWSASAAAATDPGQLRLSRSERRRLFTEQLRDRRLPADLQPASDGVHAAFTVNRPAEPASGNVSSVWVTSRDGLSRRVDGDRDGVSSAVPRWSADAQQLAVVRHAMGNPMEGQIVVFDGAAGAGTVIATVTGHVEDLVWGSDGTSMLVVCAEPGADSVVTSGAVRYQSAARRNRPTVTRPESGRRRMFDVQLGGARPRAVGPRTGSLWDVAACADETIAVVWSADSSESGWYDSYLGVLDRRSGEVRAVYRPGWQLSPVSAAPSGCRVAFAEGWASDRGRVCGEIRVVDLSGGELLEVPWFGVDIVAVTWRDEQSLWFSGWEGLHAVWGWVDLHGTVGLRRRDDIRPDSLRFSPGRTGQPSTSRAWAVSRPLDGSEPEVVAADVDGGTWSALTRLKHGQIARFSEAATRQLSWTAADGTRIDGILACPADAATTPAPLVVYAHGGPADLWSNSLTPEVRFLVDTGFSVLLANPRGSVGRGQQFARANLGDAGGAELTDLVDGIDACAALAEVDTAKVGVIGGSYGGYLAACAAAMTDRFTCSVVMFGHPDLLSARYGSNNPAFYDKLMLEGPGLGGAASFVERSPIVHVTASTAPTLLLHGQDDRCCPIGQAEEMYRALIDCGVATQLVVYPGEGHGIHGISARGDCWTRAADWLGRHLGVPQK